MCLSGRVGQAPVGSRVSRSGRPPGRHPIMWFTQLNGPGRSHGVFRAGLVDTQGVLQ